mmetsp:Transcript_48917/g.90223  ORF Transcript_48917/g.90223 Transcript_48917/m.90223 type:complete len:316 (-) Transcript_48917:74-1021(-)
MVSSPRVLALLALAWAGAYLNLGFAGMHHGKRPAPSRIAVQSYLPNMKGMTAEFGPSLREEFTTGQVLCSIGPETVLLGEDSSFIRPTEAVSQQFWSAVKAQMRYPGAGGVGLYANHGAMVDKFVDMLFPGDNAIIPADTELHIYFIPPGTAKFEYINGRFAMIKGHPFAVWRGTAMRLTSFMRIAKLRAREGYAMCAVESAVPSQLGDMDASLTWSVPPPTPFTVQETAASLKKKGIKVEDVRGKLVLSNEMQAMTPVFSVRVQPIPVKYKVGKLVTKRELNLAEMVKVMVSFDYLCDEEDFIPAEDDFEFDWN